MDLGIALFLVCIVGVFALVVAVVALQRASVDHAPVITHAIARLSQIDERLDRREAVERLITDALDDIAESDSSAVADGLLRKLESLQRTLQDFEQALQVTAVKLGERVDRLESLAMNRPVLVKSLDREGGL